MGRIFSYAEIESGLVPTADDFDTSRNIFIDLAKTEIGRNVIDGAFIYGSVAIGEQGPRSDFDALIALSDANPSSYIAVRAISRAITAATRGTVGIEAFAYSREALENRQHTIDRFFGQHLSSTDRLVIENGNDPAEYMRFSGDTRSARDIFASYLYAKKWRLTGSYLATGETDTTEGGLQRMLELPNAIGRKALQCLAEVRGESTQIRSADKTLLRIKGREMFSEFGVEQGFDSLVSANSYYNELLTKTLAGEVERQDYDEVIRELHATLPNAIDWLVKVQEAIIPRLASFTGSHLTKEI